MKMTLESSIASIVVFFAAISCPVLEAYGLNSQKWPGNEIAYLEIRSIKPDLSGDNHYIIVGYTDQDRFLVHECSNPDIRPDISSEDEIIKNQCQLKGSTKGYSFLEVLEQKNRLRKDFKSKKSAKTDFRNAAENALVAGLVALGVSVVTSSITSIPITAGREVAPEIVHKAAEEVLDANWARFSAWALKVAKKAPSYSLPHVKTMLLGMLTGGVTNFVRSASNSAFKPITVPDDYYLNMENWRVEKEVSKIFDQIIQLRAAGKEVMRGQLPCAELEGYNTENPIISVFQDVEGVLGRIRQ